MALCSRRSRMAFVDIPGSTLDVSPSLLRSSLPKPSAESLQGLAKHGFVHADALNCLFILVVLLVAAINKSERFTVPVGMRHHCFYFQQHHCSTHPAKNYERFLGVTKSTHDTARTCLYCLACGCVCFFACWYYGAFVVSLFLCLLFSTSFSICLFGSP